MKNIDYCKGCYIIKTCKFTKYSSICPCVKCLIKMVCLAFCDEFTDFHNKNKTEGKVT